MLLYLIGLVIFVAILMTISSFVRGAAAKAYEPETAVLEGFTVYKPQDFVTPVEENGEFTWQAYSRDFGKKRSGHLRQCHAKVRTFIGEKANAYSAKLKKEGFEVLQPGDSSMLQKTSKNEDADVKMLIKLLGSDAKLFVLEIEMPSEFTQDYEGRVGRILESFQLN